MNIYGDGIKPGFEGGPLSYNYSPRPLEHILLGLDC
jgi:hypothetical protein